MELRISHSLISIKTRLIFSSSPELMSNNVTGMVSEFEHPSGTKPSYLKGFLWVPTHTDARGAQSERNAFISIQVPHPVVQGEDKSRIKTNAKEIKLMGGRVCFNCFGTRTRRLLGPIFSIYQQSSIRECYFSIKIQCFVGCQCSMSTPDNLNLNKHKHVLKYGDQSP